MSSTLHVVMADGGKLAKDAGANLHKTQLLEFYRLMVLSRELDQACSDLHRDGKIGFHVTTRGTESTVTGAACALAPGDWIFPSWRFTSVAVARGANMATVFDNYFGNDRDTARGRQGPGSMGFSAEKIVPVSAPVGTHIAQAVGMAQAAAIKGAQHTALCLFGGAAHESPDFHSGRNFAGVLNAPAVFLTTGETDSGKAYGIDSIHVDGSDVLAVYSVVAAACAKARSGKGPTLIHAHETDADGGLSRFEAWLHDAGIIDVILCSAIAEEARHEIRAALKDSEGIGFPDQSTLFGDVVSTPGSTLTREAEAIQRFGAEYGGSTDPDADFILG